MTMRWLASPLGRFAVATLVLLATGSPATAQTPGARRSPGLPRRPDGLLAAAIQAQNIGATIVAGRIVISAARGRSVPWQRDSGEVKEQLSLPISARGGTIKYDRSTPNELISMEFFGGVRVHLERTPKGDAAVVPVEFEQSSQGTMSLSVGLNGQRQIYTGASLWHLLLAEPDVCRQHLLPLLALINDEWDLQTVSEQIEQTLIEEAGSQAPPDRRRWVALVEQLGSDRFTQREGADRELRALGPLVSSYLQTLDLEALDAEQRFRIRRIVLALTDSHQPDTPDQVVLWLAGDPQVWLALLDRDTEATRRIAAKQLTHLLGRPIAFDPGADVQTRETQFKRLQADLRAAGG